MGIDTRQGRFAVYVSKDNFRFNAAHFMAYPGFRERLHGHNYRVSVRVEGALGSDGYVVDFGDIKRVARRVCDEMNERVLVPLASDCLRIERRDGQVEIATEDGSQFSLPEGDCVLLPIAHSSAEELAAYVCDRLLAELEVLGQRGVRAIEVTVAETPGQEARYRHDL
ncbi:MAG: 6-carboxytetrahydropterin synthase [Candidatus Dadabacteria bacterium]|nr:MAG: 6-carboxytetrahydropterin synthase [Candidatus Dadabacteria bacterium]